MGARNDELLTIALGFTPAALRPRIEALFAFDALLGRHVARANDPMRAAVRFAWWREVCTADDAAAREREVPGLGAESGAALLPIVEGWAELSDATALTPAVLAGYGNGRGWLLAHVARLHGEKGDAGGASWALYDLALNCRDAGEREAALAAARAAEPGREAPRGAKMARVLRALTREAARTRAPLSRFAILRASLA